MRFIHLIHHFRDWPRGLARLIARNRAASSRAARASLGQRCERPLRDLRCEVEHRRVSGGQLCRQGQQPAGLVIDLGVVRFPIKVTVARTGLAGRSRRLGGGEQQLVEPGRVDDRRPGRAPDTVGVQLAQARLHRSRRQTVVVCQLSYGPVDLHQAVRASTTVIADDAIGEPQRRVAAERHRPARGSTAIVRIPRSRRLRNHLRKSMGYRRVGRRSFRKCLRNWLRFVTLHAGPPAPLGSVGR
jgi:hypothetical protein